LLSCEASAIDQQVFTINTAEWTDTTFVGLEEPDNKMDIKIRPNPVDKGELYIDGLDPDMVQCRLSMYNSIGAKIPWKEQKYLRGVNVQPMKVRLPDASPGLYILHIYTGDMNETQKVIIR
jgi:hypothetical protein